MSKKKNIINKIKEDYKEYENNKSLTNSNEIAGATNLLNLFGGPILITIGAVGTVDTSYTSYKQFKSDCEAYIEQYKKQYDEYKYLSLYHFINSVILIIKYLEEYIIILDDNGNSAPPNINNIIENLNQSIENNLTKN